MATANLPTDSEMTSEAYDLLDCFVSGLDAVVYEIAEAIAKANGQVTDAGTVEINQDDVKQAAKSVFEAIQEQAGKSIPAAAARQIEEMHECVLMKCEIRNTGK